ARRELARELLRLHRGQVDADLAHRGEDLGVDALARLRSGGDRPGLRGIGEGVEERRRHLRATGVVDAREDHLVGHGGPVLSRVEDGSTTTSGGWSQAKNAVAAPAPTSCATTNPGT